MKSSLLVVDDHEGIAVALAHLLETDGWAQVFVASDRRAAMELTARHRPDIVSVDLTLGQEHGLDLLNELRAAYPHLTLVVLTASGGADVAVRCLRAGASAFVPKSSDPADLVAAFAAADQGLTWLPNTMVGPIISLLLDPPPASVWEELVATLSAREYGVLELMVAGMDRRAIAEELTISLNTVRTHVKNILAKLGVHASLEAVSLALRAGVRPPERASA